MHIKRRKQNHLGRTHHSKSDNGWGALGEKIVQGTENRHEKCSCTRYMSKKLAINVNKTPTKQTEGEEIVHQQKNLLPTSLF